MNTVESNPQTPAVRGYVVGLIDEFFSRVDRAESVADLLEEDAEFTTPQRHAQGKDAVAKLLLSLADVRREKGREARHFGGNVSIQRLDDGLYRVRSLVIVLALDRGEEDKGVLNMGDHDDLVKLYPDGTCRFVKRTMQPVFQFGLTPLGESR
ncbi:nuclear transport factor 2 family protein [Paraburkholderia sediminicola]|uniref:nuclear transport factor 2 family protein n=1 Tax=Paraburkholderia sediminicola TaxID=458836 RepID=UPI0038B9084B